jgi:D-alanyl-D-alanine carboxypeptidase/D-alanyl-D-alanine-endopeptidase (penicillin-binding protein 4)
MMEGVKGKFPIAIACALVVAGCGGGGHSSNRGTNASDGAPALEQTTTTRTMPAPRPAPVTPSLTALRRALRKQLAKAGHNTGVLIVDLTRKELLYTEHAGVARPPASVEKIYTTVALLKKLGPRTRLETSVQGHGHLDGGGTWHGDLYLRGGGDPTLGDGSFNRVWELGYGPTAVQLTNRLRKAGIRRVTGHLIADESYFDTRRGGPRTDYKPDTPDFGGQLSALTYDHGSATNRLSPATFAARQLAETMTAQGIAVKASTRSGRTPANSRKLVVVHSPPLSVLLKLMDVPSDDLFADLLTKQLGKRFGNGGTLSAGAHVIAQEIAADYGIHPHIGDGSGLARTDRTSPRQVVDLLMELWHTSIGRVLDASLPVMGVSGTVRTIAIKTPAQGHCIAKTGTLDYVTNLAGYCNSRGHHKLAFAIFVDGPQNWQALVLFNPIMAAIAKY